MTEQWLQITDYPGYEVSNFGKVRSLDREIKLTVKGKEVTRKLKGKELVSVDTGHGYLQVNLSNNEGPRCHKVANLVAYHFLPPCPGVHTQRLGGYTIDHIDNNNQNNRADNLQWLTMSENARKKALESVLSEDDVREMRIKAANGTTYQALSEEYGTTKANIGYIVRRDTWKHVE